MKLDLEALSMMTQEVSLEDALPAAADLIAGRIRGRLIVDVNR